MDGAAPWRSRIVGEGEEAPDQLLANPKNWRTHPARQQAALSGVLSDVGWVQRVIVNRRTGHLIDGHLRVTLALRRGEPTIPVLYVDLDESEEALVLATLDPIAALAGADRAALSGLLEDVRTTDEAVRRLLEDVAAQAAATATGDEKLDGQYSRKIESLHYEPKGPKPGLADLTDDARTRDLLAEIDASELPEDEKAFLREAAGRHRVFHYRRIADYYAHATPEMQRLMEASALVIIDFEEAIQRGFARLTEAIAAAFQADHLPAGQEPPAPRAGHGEADE